jgi:hypothetical protein
MMNLKDSILRNWKTTSIGGVIAASGYISMFPGGFDENAVNLARFVNLGGMASLGIVSKDADVSGKSTTKSENEEC